MKFHEPLPKPRVEAIEIIDFAVTVKPTTKTIVIEPGEEHPGTHKVYKTKRKYTYPLLLTDIKIKFKSNSIFIGDVILLDTGLQFCVTEKLENFCLAIIICKEQTSVIMNRKHESVLVLYSMAPESK